MYKIQVHVKYRSRPMVNLSVITVNNKIIILSIPISLYFSPLSVQHIPTIPKILVRVQAPALRAFVTAKQVKRTDAQLDSQ